MFRLVIWVDGERIVRAEPHIGYLHRGSEKLSEGELYSQVITLFDRLDYVANLNGELAFCLAAKKKKADGGGGAGTRQISSGSFCASSIASPATCSSTESTDWTWER